MSSTFCREIDIKDHKYKLEKKHDYYYQMQCHLYCTDGDWRDFVLRTDKEIHIQQIQRDKRWWDIQLEKLKKFLL